MTNIINEQCYFYVQYCSKLLDEFLYHYYFILQLIMLIIQVEIILVKSYLDSYFNIRLFLLIQFLS